MRVLFALLVLASTGCATGAAHERLLLDSQIGVDRVEVGMWRADFVQAMPGKSYRVREAGIGPRLNIRNPYRETSIRAEDGTDVDVMYYYTRLVHADGLVSHEELTPFAFEEERLVGWGWRFLEERCGRRALRLAMAQEIQDELDAERAKQKPQKPQIDPLEQQWRETLEGIHRTIGVQGLRGIGF